MKWPIAGTDLYTSVTDVPSGEQIGSIEEGVNGKAFAYALAGASNLVVGNLLQAPAISTQFDDMVVPAAVAAGTGPGVPITVTNGTVTVNTNDFVGGTAVVSNGEEYTILSTGSSAVTSGNPLPLYFDRPIRTAWTTSTTVTLRQNPYHSVIQMPTTPTGPSVGVAIYAIPLATYGYVQVRGVAGVLSDNTTGAIGSDASNSTATAGAVGVAVTGTTRSLIGTFLRAAASAKEVPVWLKIT